MIRKNKKAQRTKKYTGVVTFFVGPHDVVFLGLDEAHIFVEKGRQSESLGHHLALGGGVDHL